MYKPTAYMGDAVYEKYIREYVIRQGLCKNGLLHKKTIKCIGVWYSKDGIVLGIDFSKYSNR